MKYSFYIFLVFLIPFLSCSSCKEDGAGYGPFNDRFPVEFNFYKISDEIATRIYTSDGNEITYTLPEREAELDKQMTTAQNQITYIKLLGPDQSEIKGKYLDGITEVILDAKYSLSGSVYTFSKDLITQVLKYNATRNADTLTMKGICCVRYNNGVRKGRSTTIQVSGYTLDDEKAKTQGSDTLYYRIFNVLLSKK
ncbi:MAG: hypothetical protein J5I59_06480 [Saprospiraceae bacterium]|nr:hypothetical protein [Saprospiraceae bacterium]